MAMDPSTPPHVAAHGHKERWHGANVGMAVPPQHAERFCTLADPGEQSKLWKNHVEIYLATWLGLPLPLPLSKPTILTYPNKLKPISAGLC